MEGAPPHQDFDDDNLRAGRRAFKKGGVVAVCLVNRGKVRLDALLSEVHNSDMTVQGCTVDLPMVTR